MQKKIIFIRHIEIEGPGTFGKFLEQNNVPYQIIDMHEHGADALSSFDLADAGGIVVLGGPMNVYEEDKYKFLRVEKFFLKDAIKKNIPIIGICLGAQLLACVLGSKVSLAAMKEVGWFDISLEEGALKDALFKDLVIKMKVFQWHEDTFDLPPGAVLLAKGNGMNQAFSYNGFVWGLQFHVEVSGPMIKSWEDAYIKGRIDQAPPFAMPLEYPRIPDDYNARAENIYSAFLREVGRREGRESVF